jgi:hypothetical protein
MVLPGDVPQTLSVSHVTERTFVIISQLLPYRRGRGASRVRRVRRKRSADVRIVYGLCVAEGKRRADVQLRIASGFGKDQCAGVQERRDAPGTLPSVMHALVDALSTYGIKHIDIPATPLRVRGDTGAG